jgi:hypothetical protein
MEEAFMLLSVIEKCAGHGPKLGGIVAEAMTRLTEINEECKQHALERAEEEAAADAEAMAKMKAEADADEEATKPKAVPAAEFTKKPDDGPSVPRRV